MANIIKNRANKICFVTWEYPPTIGGVGTSAQRVVGYLVKAGYDVDIVTKDSLIRSGIREEKDRANGVRVFRTQNVCKAVELLDRDRNYDIFHGFFLAMAYACLLVSARRGKRPTIASLRGGDLWSWQGLSHSRAIVSFILQNATRMTFPSSNHFDEAKRLAPGIEGKSTIILNSIRPVSAKWDLTPRNLGIVGTVGKFRRVKNLSLLLNAYAMVPKRNRKGVLLVGDFRDSEPEEKERITALSKSLEIEREVTMTGFVPRESVPEYLMAMRIFVLTSSYDTLPNTLLEAAKVGVPIVTTEVAGVSELIYREIDEGISVVPDRDEKLLADRISNVLQDDNLARHLSRAGNKMLSHLWPKEEEAWVSLYEDVIHKVSTYENTSQDI